MKKRLLSLVLCLVMVFSLFPMIDAPARAVVEQDVYESIDGVTWTADPALYQQYAAQSVDNQLYAKIGDEFYPVDYTSTQGELWHADTRTNWTATSAYTAGARGSASDSTLYYEKNLANSSKVVVSKTTKYQSVTNEIDMGASYMNHSYFENHHYSTDFYVYVPHSGTDVDGSYSCWHRVYYREDGYTGDGYYYTFYYYTNSVEGSGASFSNGSAGDVKGSGSSQVRLLCNYHECATWGSRIGVFFEKDGYIKYWHNSNGNAGTDGNLYKTNGSSNEYNYMTAGDTILACQAPASVYSHNYSGTLYTRVNNKVTALKANNQVISNPITEDNETLYTGTLYIKLPNEVTDPNPSPTTEPNPEGILNPGGVDDAGFKLQKNLSDNGDGTYDITMQSYSTANTRTESLVEKVPTDFVVIVDQSGSMSTSDMATGYTAATTKTLEDIAKGSYYYKDGDTYYRVYATRDYLMEYHASETLWTKPIIEDAGMDLSWFQGEEDATFSQANQYYYKTTDGVYRPVHMSATGKIGTYYIKFYYENAQGTRVDFVRPSRPVYKNVFGSDTSKYGPGSFGYGAVNAAVLAAYPTTTAYTYSTFLGVTTGMYVNYPMYSRHVGYTQLCYRDVNGVEHIVPSDAGIETAEYCNSSEQAMTAATNGTRMNYSGLYQATGYESRLTALKGALTAFVKAVADESDTKNGANTTCAVDNRIAMVGFSSEGFRTTEVITGNNVAMTRATTADYKAALISATNGTVGTVNPALTTAIDSLEAYGGTQPELGFQMAKSVFDNRENKDYTFVTGDLQGTNTKRNTIVIFFTDGQPGDYDDSNQYSEANDVVAASLPLKNAGVKVFSIGVFGESDGNPLTYDASNDWATNDSGQRVRVSSLRSSAWKYLGGYVGVSDDGNCLRRQWRPNNADGYTPTANDTIYDYMSVVSSNYPQAQNFIAADWINPDKEFSGNYIAATEGVRHSDTAADTNQFYRMAANQATLVSAFKQSVSYASVQQINSGAVNLNSTSIFRDAININDFDVSNATYSVTWQPIKVDKTAIDTTGSAIVNDSSRPLVTPVVNQKVPANGVIEYSGFDYGANFVSWGKTEGYKLVVTVHGIVPTTYNQTIKSNADKVVNGKDVYACGIYELGKDTPAHSVQSPTLYIELHEPTTANVEMSKSISNFNETDGSYTITLDAYATGNFDAAQVKLDKDGYLMDVINLENLAVRSDLSEADVHVYTLKGTDDGNGNVTFENEANKVDITDQVEVSFSDVTDQQTGKTNRAVTVTGFDYAANFIGAPKFPNVAEGTAKNQGKKLIVTIGGLVPVHPGNGQTSNAGAGVYNKNDQLVQDVASPTFDISSNNSKTYVVDFSAPMIIANDATSVAKMSGANGDFSLIEGNVVYQLIGSVHDGNLILDGVDKAFAFAKPVDLDVDTPVWAELTTVPASSVFFDDDFVREGATAVNVDDGHGYNVAFEDSKNYKQNEERWDNSEATQTYYFTFTGTGADVYATTEADGAYVQAALFRDPNGVGADACVTTNRVGSNVTMKQYSEDTRYNVPTLHFAAGEHGTYTIRVKALKNSNFRLDGIRVYNALTDQSYYTDNEVNASFFNLHELLINGQSDFQYYTGPSEIDMKEVENLSPVSGILFIDNAAGLTNEGYSFNTETNESDLVKLYSSSFEAYKANSPKNEIYLANGQGIAFTISNYGQLMTASNNKMQVQVGLSVANNTAETKAYFDNEALEGNTNYVDVKSPLDMYYTITPASTFGDSATFIIKNVGNAVLSITDLKVSGTSEKLTATPASNAQVLSVNEDANSAEDLTTLKVVVNTKTLRALANVKTEEDQTATDEPETTPDPTPDPTPTTSIHDIVKQIVSSFVSSLFKSISRLFGN